MTSPLTIKVALKYGGLDVIFDRPDSKYVEVGGLGRFFLSGTLDGTINMEPCNVAASAFKRWKAENKLPQKIKGLRIPPETTAPIRAEEKARTERFKQAFFNKKIKITAGYSLSEPHWVIDYESEKIEAEFGLDAFYLVHGVAKDAWCYYLIFDRENLPARDSDITEKVVDFLSVKIEAEKAEELSEESERNEIFERAKETGEKQKLHGFMADCCSNECDCSFDSVTIWAMPDGSTKRTSVHCY